MTARHTMLKQFLVSHYKCEEHGIRIWICESRQMSDFLSVSASKTYCCVSDNEKVKMCESGKSEIS